MSLLLGDVNFSELERLDKPYTIGEHELMIFRSPVKISHHQLTLKQAQFLYHYISIIPHPIYETCSLWVNVTYKL